MPSLPIGPALEPSPPRSNWQARARRPLVILFCLLLLPIEAWHEWDIRRHMVADIQTSAANLARSLVRDVENDFVNANTALIGMVEMLQAEGTGPANLAQIGRVMHRQLDNQSDLRNFSLYGASGELLHSSWPQPGSNVSIADRDYFRHHREEVSDLLQIGTAVRSRLDGRWIITLSRRFQDREGRFAGVAVAAIEVATLARIFAQFDLGRQGSIALVRSDSHLIARWPSDDAALGAPVFERTVLRDQVARRRSGVMRTLSPIDGQVRLGAYESSDRFPITILAGQSEQEALAGWEVQAALRAAFVTLLAGLLLLLERRLAAQHRRRRTAERVLAESESEFRLLTEHASDMVSRIGPDGRIRYASPAALRLLGWPPQALLGRHIADFADPEDRPALLAVLEAEKAPPQGQVTCRVTRPDGTKAWIETTFRGITDGEIGTAGSVAVSRDVTERRAMEARLAELATTDGLTGLPNRRRFDETLALEWSRSAREGAWLSVLLIDVDRFKMFNDRYGHLAGDEALRAVARAINSAIRRPLDLAARYGGEEFAVILPNTDAAGAVGVAERLRLAVLACGIPHAANEAGHVTVSLGLAGVQPVPAAAPAFDMLLGAADAALYEAKRTGRNRLVQAPLITLLPPRRQTAQGGGPP